MPHIHFHDNDDDPGGETTRHIRFPNDDDDPGGKLIPDGEIIPGDISAKSKDDDDDVISSLSGLVFERDEPGEGTGGATGEGNDEANWLEDEQERDPFDSQYGKRGDSGIRRRSTAAKSKQIQVPLVQCPQCKKLWQPKPRGKTTKKGDKEKGEKEKGDRDDIRYHYICPHCKKLDNRLGEHLKTCKKAPKSKKENKLKRIKQDIEWRSKWLKGAHRKASVLLSHTYIRKSELLRAIKAKNLKERYYGVKGFLLQRGHEFHETSETEWEDEDNDDEHEGLHKISHRQAELSSNQDEDVDDELERRLLNVKSPKIYDPSINMKFKLRKVMRLQQENRLFRRFGKGTEFFIRFQYKRELDRRAITRGDLKIIRAQITQCRRLLAYIFEKTNEPLDSINDPNRVAKLLDSHMVGKYFEKLEKKCEMSGLGLNNVEKAVNILIDYLLNRCEKGQVSKEARDVLRSLSEYMKSQTKRTQQIIKRDKDKKLNDAYEAEKYTPADVRDIFRLELASDMLEEAKAMLLVAKEGEVGQEEYDHILGQCIGILSIYYGQRAQCPINVTVKEWANRARYDDGTCYIELHNHKRMRLTGRPHEIPLKPDQEELIDFYFRECRQKHSKVNKKHWKTCEEPLLIQYESKGELGNPTRTLVKWEKRIGAPKVFKPNLVRKIFVNAAEQNLTSYDQEKVSVLLGHTKRTRDENYLQPYVGQSLAGAEAIDYLEHILSSQKRPSRIETLSDIDQEQGQGPEQEQVNWLDDGQEQEQVNWLDDAPNQEELDQYVAQAPSQEGMTSREGSPLEVVTETTNEDVLMNYLFEEYYWGIEQGIATQSILENDPYLDAYSGDDSDEQKAYYKRLYYQLHNQLGKDRGAFIVDRLSEKRMEQLGNAASDQERAQVKEDWANDEKKKIEYQAVMTEMNWPIRKVNFDRYVLPGLKREFKNYDELNPIRRKHDDQRSPSEPAPKHKRFKQDELAEPAVVEQADAVVEQVEQQVEPYSKEYTDKQLLKLCKNQQWPHLEIIDDLPIRDRAVFTKADIAPNQILCDYHGVRVDEAEHMEKMRKLYETDRAQHDRIESYRVSVEDSTSGRRKHYVIEATEDDDPPSYGRLMNHSFRHPNCKLHYRIVTDKHGNKENKVFLKTLDNNQVIPKGVELLWDYKGYKDQMWYWWCPCENLECWNKCGNKEYAKEQIEKHVKKPGKGKK